MEYCRIQIDGDDSRNNTEAHPHDRIIHILRRRRSLKRIFQPVVLVSYEGCQIREKVVNNPVVLMSLPEWN